MMKNKANEKALKACQQAVERNPAKVQVYLDLAGFYAQQGQVDLQREVYAKALASNAKNSDFQLNLANAVFQGGDLEGAERIYEALIQSFPQHVNAKYNLGVVLKKQKKWAKALDVFQQIVAQQADFTNAWINLGDIAEKLGQRDLGLTAYRKALELSPDMPEVHNNLANILWMYKKDFDSAINHFQKALSLGLRHPIVLKNLGSCLSVQKRFGESVDYMKQALALDPDNVVLHCDLIHLQMKNCEWEGLDDLKNKILLPSLEYAKDHVAPVPFVFLSYPIADMTEADQWVLAESFSKNIENEIQPLTISVKPHQRLRIGYVSADFRDHATTHLMMGLFGRHDRTKFEIFAYAMNAGDGSDYRQRVEKDCEHFIDISTVNDEQAARQIAQDEIDILVDLKGYTGDSRPGIFAYRPAPVQAQYLGYPGTMGAKFIDYVITDRVVTPPEQQPFYTERFAYMPHSYQVNDQEQKISDKQVSRSSQRLPDAGFVFCCFCAHNKIEPSMFDVWMNILKAVPSSVLWLIEGLEPIPGNLRAEAAKRGVDPNRLCFAPFASKADHLARFKLADLFLDTYYYNGHTTTSDALWAGVPAITCPRKTFASRVSASLLKAVGMEELIVDSLEAYQEKAIYLAENPAALKDLREKLGRNRLTQPLFNTDLFAKDLEVVYENMWKERQPGLAAVAASAAPQTIPSVDPVSEALNAYNKEDFEGALSLCQEVLRANPQRFDVWTLYGMALKGLERLEESVKAYRKAIEINPNYPDAHNNLANNLKKMGQFEEAARCYDKAVQLVPEYWSAYIGLNGTLQALGRYSEAMDCLNKVIAKNPEHADAHFDRGLLYYLLGDLKAGSEEYEWRYKRGVPPPRGFPQPIWKGESFAGKRLLVYSEQGIGDALQMMRYLPRVVALGGEVILEIHEPLIRLARSVSGLNHFFPKGAALPAFDLQISIMSLPLVFGSTMETIPNQVPYLEVPAELSAAWRQRLSRHQGFKVGMVWAGRPTYGNDSQRSPGLRALMALWQMTEVNYFLMQVGEAQHELWDVTLPENCIDLSSEINDFTDTAAIVQNLDLIISPDTAMAHLAGAMGKPVWGLHAHLAEWRWMTEREDTPWYPSMRIFRQPQRGRWDLLVDKVKKELANLLTETVIEGVAKENLKKAVELKPEPSQTPVEAVADSPEVVALFQKAYGAFQKNALEQALNFIQKAHGLNPGSISHWVLKGMILRRLGRWDEAVEAYHSALRFDPNCIDAYNNMANGYRALKQWDKASECYRKALEINPGVLDLWTSIADVLRLQGKLDEAEASVQKALSLSLESTEAYNALGNIRVDMKQVEEGIACFKKALQINPNYVVAIYNLGVALQLVDKHREAVDLYLRLLKLDAKHTSALYNLGLAYQRIMRIDEADKTYLRVLELDANHFSARFNRASLLEYRNRTEQALEQFKICLAQSPDNLNLLCEIARSELKFCDWSRIPHLRQQIIEPTLRLDSSSEPTSPFLSLTLPTPITEAELKTIAEKTGRYISSSIAPLPPVSIRPLQGRKVRLGYLSADFHNHATAHLMLGVFEKHDRSQFEVFAYSMGPDDGSDYRKRIRSDVDRFIDISDMTDKPAADLIRADELDILIDLKGYTRDSRPKILAYRPAPVQLQYLGYPGTMGADFIDYLITDKIVTPPSHQPFYTEKFAYVPNCYQVNDDKQAISSELFTRESCGLPEKGFVFCCFCSIYKLEPFIFDVWMRLLKAEPDSVLWLIDGPEIAKANVRREALARGVSSDRLIFAPMMAKDRHLARYHLADIFLDTYYCNGHTTTSDALWAGIPVITCPGDTFASRVAASILTAMDLSDLIVKDMAAYEKLALEFARSPGELAKLKSRLSKNLKTSSLYDTGRFVKDYEKVLLGLLRQA